jgi:hypothetical protein
MFATSGERWFPRRFLNSGALQGYQRSEPRNERPAVSPTIKDERDFFAIGAHGSTCRRALAWLTATQPADEVPAQPVRH